ncbi:MAG: ribosome silencing factor [Candidatus Omnitrophica bacterium]|nr:ribosome silencing factor [Candidatus Omnitrophota bacterium]
MKKGVQVIIETKNLALRIASVAKSKKAEDVIVLDMRSVSSFCDYFVILACASLRQVNAVRQAIEDDLVKIRIKSLSKVASNDESGWIVLDFSSVVVHVFYKPTREFYSLERLWSDAKRVRIPSKTSK